MVESWFNLSRGDQTEALEVAAARLGRPAHLLEKDIWVVWVLNAIYDSPLATKLTFKGGTSLSKVYQIIDRFSEDIDLTYDIREIVPDLLQGGDPIPTTFSQESKISKGVRNRLPQWIEGSVRPVIEAALASDGIQATVTLAGSECEKLNLGYTPVKTGSGYSAPTVQLEFGGRATGEPHQFHGVVCDMASVIDGVAFPTAKPLVMAAERTFWEKATAAHVYCLQGRLRGERYSRHWYDLAAFAKTPHCDRAAGDRALGFAVAQHKSMFFSEKDASGAKVDYVAAVNGAIRLVPQGDSRKALERDYGAMTDDGLIPLDAPSFAEIMTVCESLQNRLNLKPLETE